MGRRRLLGYALFQTANNFAAMTDVCPEEHGVISGMLNLSRHLGLITGASVLGAECAFATSTTDITTGRPGAVATGMRITFAFAAMLIIVALTIAAGNVLPHIAQSALSAESNLAGVDQLATLARFKEI